MLGWLVVLFPSSIYRKPANPSVSRLCAFETADGCLLPLDASSLTCGSHLRGMGVACAAEGKGLALRPEACFMACF